MNHTSHHDFRQLFPPNHCVLGPICEYKLHPFLKGEVNLRGRAWHQVSKQIEVTVEHEGKYILRIPHVVKDIGEVEHAVRVRHIKMRNGKPDIAEIPRKVEGSMEQEMFYDLDDSYITIYMKRFCKVAISLEGIKHCGRIAEMLVFGKLDNFPQQNSKVTLNIYFGSEHYESTRKDYFKVI